MIPLGGAVSKQDKYKAVYSPFDQDKVRSRKRHKITKIQNSRKICLKKFDQKLFWNIFLKFFWQKNLESFRKIFGKFFEIVNSVNKSFFDQWFFHFDFFFVEHFEGFRIHMTLEKPLITHFRFQESTSGLSSKFELTNFSRQDSNIRLKTIFDPTTGRQPSTCNSTFRIGCWSKWCMILPSK